MKPILQMVLLFPFQKQKNALDVILNMIRRKEKQRKAITRSLFIIAWQRVKSVLVIPEIDSPFLPPGLYTFQLFPLL